MVRIRKAVQIFCLCLILFLFVCSGIPAGEPRKLTSFKTGYFYAFITRDEGMVQLTECMDLSKATGFTRGEAFDCAPDGRGFRCTGRGLDVIFIFKDLKTCHIDRSRALDSEEE